MSIMMVQRYPGPTVAASFLPLVYQAVTRTRRQVAPGGVTLSWGDCPMRTQQLRRSGCLAVGAAALWLACGSLAAQSPAASTKTYAPPRLADGHPDLQGTYDAATMTPVERPAEYGNRLTLTPEEAAEMESQQQERTEAGSEPSQADRALPPAGGDRTPTNSYLESVFRAGGGVVGGYNLFWISPGSQLATVDDRNARPSSSIR